MSVTVQFCGEEFVAPDDRPLTIGRVADVEIDDNPYLHRVFLQVHHEHGLWWLTNVGWTLTATVADTKGLFQAWLSPGPSRPGRWSHPLTYLAATPRRRQRAIIRWAMSWQTPRPTRTTSSTGVSTLVAPRS